MTARTNRPLVVIGSGPGIGRHVACLFASRRFNKIALVARSQEKLARDQEAVTAVLPGKLTVRAYSVDVTETEKFAIVMDQIRRDLGSPEFVFYNAAEIAMTKLFETGEDQMIYDFKTTCTALHVAAKWAIPQLQDLALTEVTAKPSFLVTNSLLPKDPIPDLFCLSMVKAAQRNIVQSLSKVYGNDGVHIGMVTVGGPVDPSAKTHNPTNIAARTWELFEQPQEQHTFEVEIL
ncbi:Fc.00g046390.m01.CDS01 [Cosmosporella sp. VM-42]